MSKDAVEQGEGGLHVEPALDPVMKQVEAEAEDLKQVESPGGGAPLEEEKTLASSPAPEELPPGAEPRGTGFALEPITTGLAAGMVRVGALRFRARKANSVSVALLQARLNELGYGSVRNDLIGWFHTGTVEAVRAWQDAESVGDGTGTVTLEVAQAIFDGTAIAVTDD